MIIAALVAIEIAPSRGAACLPQAGYAPTESGLFVDGAAADYGAEDFGLHVI